MDLIVGQEYRRRALHEQYGGSRQGGISPSRQFPIVMLISSPAGQQHGYNFDGPQPDGTYWYTGEGQLGDMTFVRGNRAIRDAAAKGRTLHLFEETRSGWLRYVGPAQCVGSHGATAPDRTGAARQVIVFEFVVDGDDQGRPAADGGSRSPTIDRALWRMPLDALRQRALAKVAADAPPAVRRANAYTRSEAVRVFVLRRANGRCECCGRDAPFTTKQGTPYLEPHHIRRRADGGPDHPRWVGAICPNCHREIHYGMRGDEINRMLSDRLATLTVVDGVTP